MSKSIDNIDAIAKDLKLLTQRISISQSPDEAIDWIVSLIEIQVKAINQQLIDSNATRELVSKVIEVVKDTQTDLTNFGEDLDLLRIQVNTQGETVH